eukprot:CAMPEP_0197859854 /NCGR_PEP_ID=MMETSP1438-20131217/34792_1 /TAXON_ID=1461541 /ORGANISM="Pterosperma sp., Strain CCMP1384" /LENGTH=56 /DNA_ID=CAMNT_0043476513 /DNA_START=64 /DNA_END=230 /DNA_ORIENTATION=+
MFPALRFFLNGDLGDLVHASPPSEGLVSPTGRSTFTFPGLGAFEGVLSRDVTADSA